MNKVKIAENECNQLLKQLNKKYQIFDSLKRLNLTNRVDFIGMRGSKQYYIELKQRYKLYNTLFIREEKYNYLMSKANPLYINFINGKAYIFNLLKVKPINKKTLLVWNPCKGYREECNYELNLSDAIELIL